MATAFIAQSPHTGQGQRRPPRTVAGLRPAAQCCRRRGVSTAIRATAAPPMPSPSLKEPRLLTTEETARLKLAPGEMCVTAVCEACGSPRSCGLLHCGGLPVGMTASNGNGHGAPAAVALDTLAYLKKILTSRVYDVAVETSLTKAGRLSERLGCTVLLKREDEQPVFSFKLRGAYNMMAQLPASALARGVITASAGNHAQGVAMAAKRLGCDAVIAMPVTTPAIKVNAVRRWGATVVLHGEAFDATQAHALHLASTQGRVYIPPFDHPDVIAGQGTVGMEILREIGAATPAAIFVPVGGGGLLAGIALYIKALRPEIKVIGVEPSGAAATALSLAAGCRVTLARVDAFADGVAVRTPGTETLRLIREHADGIVTVDNDAVCAAIKDVFEDTRSILEPAGAVALAGAKAYIAALAARGAPLGPGESVVAIASGANMNFDRLRLVAERAELGSRREALLATQIPELPGAFKAFCGAIGPELSITEFKYRAAEPRAACRVGGGEGPSSPPHVPTMEVDPRSAHVFYSVAYRDDADLRCLMDRLATRRLPTLDLSSDAVAKAHLRHLVGGRACVVGEALARFEFPERAGALSRFLDVISPRWNITLFHYRADGGTAAQVLVGLDLAAGDEAELRTAVIGLGSGYACFEVLAGSHPAVDMFLR